MPAVCWTHVVSRNAIAAVFAVTAMSIGVVSAQPPRGFDPTFILRRMDRNGNGMLEPEEMEGRGGEFIKRFLGEGITRARRPIPINGIADAIRRRMESGRSGDSRSSRWRSSGSTEGLSENEPLVPGFDLVEEVEPVLGFGVSDEKFDVKVSEDDLREAERTIGRYDANRDGVLDKQEIARGRWRDPPLATDRNRDGKLTKSELAIRYAIRRKAREEGDSRRGSSSSSSSSRFGSSSRGSFSRGGFSRGGFSRGGSSGDRMAMMTDSIMRRYDQNGNGILEKSEWGSFRTDPSAADKNRDSKITKEELQAWMAERMSGRGGGDRGSRFGSRGSSRGGSESGSDNGGGGSGLVTTNTSRRSYKLTRAVERLPSDLPAWFARQDTNGDGQVSMAEYSRSWSQAVVDEFSTFDLNGDGIVTVAECQAAVEQGAVAGLAGSAGEGTELPASSSTEAGDEARPKRTKKWLKVAVSMIGKYDTNKDGVLTEDEWTKMKLDYSHADVDKDGKITPAELADAFGKR